MIYTAILSDEITIEGNTFWCNLEIQTEYSDNEFNLIGFEINDLDSDLNIEQVEILINQNHQHIIDLALTELGNAYCDRMETHCAL